MGEKKNLTLAVYDSIKEMMINYSLVPGQRLIFVDLAKQLGVSRTPVNNALSILAKEGYLDFVPNQGYTVHKLTLEEAESLYEIREILEIGTIGKSIRNLTPEKMKIIENRRGDYVEAISDRAFRRLFVLDAEFHAAIMSTLSNLYLVERYRDICQRIFLRIRTDDLRMDRQKEIVKEHDALFEAIRSHDVEYAKELIRTHNANAKKNLYAIIFSERNTPPLNRSM
jgi:DNA-binding GntR family transcriptional regulator